MLTKQVLSLCDRNNRLHPKIKSLIEQEKQKMVSTFKNELTTPIKDEIKSASKRGDKHAMLDFLAKQKLHGSRITILKE